MMLSALTVRVIVSPESAQAMCTWAKSAAAVTVTVDAFGAQICKLVADGASDTVTVAATGA